MKIVSTIGGHQIEESCGHFYPVFNGNAEFKTLRECQMYLLFHHMPLVRFIKAVDNGCTSVIEAMCAGLP